MGDLVYFYFEKKTKGFRYQKRGSFLLLKMARRLWGKNRMAYMKSLYNQEPAKLPGLLAVRRIPNTVWINTEDGMGNDESDEKRVMKNTCRWWLGWCHRHPHCGSKQLEVGLLCGLGVSGVVLIPQNGMGAWMNEPNDQFFHGWSPTTRCRPLWNWCDNRYPRMALWAINLQQQNRNNKNNNKKKQTK